MTRQFRKREDLHLVILPGMGRLRPNQILTGDQYAKFVPHLLEEVTSATSVKPAVSAPVAEVPPAPAPVPEPAPAPAPEPVVEPAAEETPAEDSDADADAEEDAEESEDADEGEAEVPAEHHQQAGTVAAPPRRKRGRPRKGS